MPYITYRCALFLLLVGVALVQHSGNTGSTGFVARAARSEFTIGALPIAHLFRNANSAHLWPGVIAALVMSTLSGFAAVYTECVLKRLRLPTQQCNVYMAAFGALFSGLGCLISDGQALNQDGFFQGWDSITLSVVAISAVGGLMVAFFLRYLDAILKNFAATAAIVLSTAASVPLFGFSPGLEWLLGAAVVVAAIALYSEPEVVDPPPLAQPPARLLMAFADSVSHGIGSGGGGGERERAGDGGESRGVKDGLPSPGKTQFGTTWAQLTPNGHAVIMTRDHDHAV